MQDPFTLCEGDNKPCRSLRHSFHRKLDSYLVELKNKTESFGSLQHAIHMLSNTQTRERSNRIKR